MLREDGPADWTKTIFPVVSFHSVETGSRAWWGEEVGVLGALPYSYLARVAAYTVILSRICYSKHSLFVFPPSLKWNLYVIFFVCFCFGLIPDYVFQC